MVETRWLDEQEKDAWTGFVSMLLLMPGRLSQPLQAHDLTLFEYIVLSEISEAPTATPRMSELARLSNGSLSRLSNVVKRLEGRALVRREPDAHDRRSTTVSLTPQGLELLRAAAPTHVDSVRELVLDPLDEEDRAALARIASRLRSRVDAADA